MTTIPREERYPLRYAPTPPHPDAGFHQFLRAVRDTANCVLPNIAQAYVRPRMVLIPLDPWLKGELRWARSVGGSASIWRPETIMTLEEGTNAGEYVYYVNMIPDSMILGTLLLVGPTQRVQVSDWNTVDFTITANQALNANLEEGATIQAWAFPVVVEGGVSKGGIQIRVSSELKLARGDSLQIPSEDGDFEFTIGRDISEAEFVEEDAEGYKYILYLEDDQTLPRDIASDETLYMRCHPAYFSGRLSLPDYSAAFLKLIGPFLLDYLSGPLLRDTKATEYCSLRTYRADRSSLTPLLPAEPHNAQVNRMPIKESQMLFWQKDAGEINHNSLTYKTIATCDTESGHFRLTEKLVPEMEVPTDQYATGYISAVAKAQLVNNESFDINDGYSLVRFEFMVDGSYTPAPGKTTIDLTLSTTDSEVAARIAAAIVNSALNIDVTQAGRVVNLANRVPGVIGNHVITNTVADAAFITSGMSGGGGGIAWLTVVEASHDATLRIQFRPNPDVVYTLTPGLNNVRLDFLPTYDPATHLDLRITSEGGATFKFSEWTLHGSRVAYVETHTVARVDSDHWAASFLFLKPLWPNFDLLKPLPDLDKMNGGALIL